jgi:hypothetical protein
VNAIIYDEDSSRMSSTADVVADGVLRAAAIDDPFGMLLLPGPADVAAIRSAYKKVALRLHPDKTGNDKVLRVFIFEKSDQRKREKKEMFGGVRPRDKRFVSTTKHFFVTNAKAHEMLTTSELSLKFATNDFYARKRMATTGPSGNSAASSSQGYTVRDPKVVNIDVANIRKFFSATTADRRPDPEDCPWKTTTTPPTKPNADDRQNHPFAAFFSHPTPPTYRTTQTTTSKKRPPTPARRRQKPGARKRRRTDDRMPTAPRFVDKK